MADSPYPLITQDTLERRVKHTDERKSALNLTDAEWTTVVEEIIGEESAFVANVLRENGVEFANYTTRQTLLDEFPIVRRAMVRLCRSSMNEIDEDGLESESIGDHSESYVASGTIRDSVEAELGEIDPPTTGGGGTGGTGDGDRITLI